VGLGIGTGFAKWECDLMPAAIRSCYWRSKKKAAPDVWKPGARVAEIKMQIRNDRDAGFSLLEIMITVSLIGLLTAIAVPNFVKNRDITRVNSIFNNLRQIDAAKEQWAIENKKGAGDTTDMVALAEYLKGGSIKPIASETYTPGVIGVAAFATSSSNLGTYVAGTPILAQ
jgi:prepilin-type N-terminal cleavage/methylation domain-containing protein